MKSSPPHPALATSVLRQLALALLLLAAGCGSAPTEEAAPPADAGAEGGDTAPETEAATTGAAGSGDCTYDEVFAEVEDLEGQARTDRLVELAQEEGEFNVYTSNTDFADLAEVFTEAYDVEVSVYRAQSNQVLQRLLQEQAAGYGGADLLEANAEAMSTANTEGLLQDYEGPATEGLGGGSHAGWLGRQLGVRLHRLLEHRLGIGTAHVV